MAEVMLIFNESTGTTVTNHGTAGDPTVASDSGTPDYTWNQDAGSYDGFLSINDGAGTNQTLVKLGSVTMPAEGDINLAVGFVIDSYDTRGASVGFFRSSHPAGNPHRGMITFEVDDPSGTGDFNLDCFVTSADGLTQYTHTFSDLSFVTLYKLSATVDVSAADFRLKLDSGSVQTATGSGSFGSSYWNTHGGTFGRGSSFSNYYGFTGDLYYFYEDRGTDIAWSDTDLANVNSDPAANLSDWPSSGPSIPPLAGRHLQNLMGQ